MKRIILYILMCILFLSLIFVLNEAHVSMQNNEPESIYSNDSHEINNSFDNFHSDLPIVIINTNDQRITKSEKVIVEISLIDRSSNNKNDKPTYTSYAELNYRGNSSYLFDKKQYRIEFKQSKNSTKTTDVSVFGMPPASDWVLNGPFLDRSLMRNYMGYSVSNSLLRWAPHTEYCEVFVDGEYMGLYLMVEAITNEAGRLNLTNFSLISGACSYVIRMDRKGTSKNPIMTYGVLNGKVRNEVSINYPTLYNITPLQQEYIMSDINSFEEALYSDYFDNPENGYQKYMDLDSFIDYFIINEFMIVIDAGNLSTYIYKDLNSKYYITVWDFNNCYNNIQWGVHPFDEFYLVHNNLFDRLVQDRYFVDRVIMRYYELRKDMLSTQNLHNMIDENYIYIKDAADRNFDVWGYTFEFNMLSLDDGISRDPESFEEAVDMLKDIIEVRGEFLDDNIDKLYEFCIN